VVVERGHDNSEHRAFVTVRVNTTVSALLILWGVNTRVISVLRLW